MPWLLMPFVSSYKCQLQPMQVAVNLDISLGSTFTVLSTNAAMLRRMECKNWLFDDNTCIIQNLFGSVEAVSKRVCSLIPS